MRIFLLSFLVLQYVQTMYPKFKLVNNFAKHIFRLLNTRMSAQSRRQIDKYDVEWFSRM